MSLTISEIKDLKRKCEHEISDKINELMSAINVPVSSIELDYITSKTIGGDISTMHNSYNVTLEIKL